MGKLARLAELFAGRHFDREVIILCVRWYLRMSAVCRWHIQPSCDGYSATHQSSKNAGTDMPLLSANRGAFTKHTLRSKANGAICIVPLIGKVGQLISG